MATKKESRKHQPSHTRYWSSKQNLVNKDINLYRHLKRNTALINKVELPQLPNHTVTTLPNKQIRIKGKGAVAIVRAINLGVNVNEVINEISKNNWKRVLLLVGNPNKENLDYTPKTDKAKHKLQQYNPKQYKKVFA